jgi:tripartite-type tricarboxylate transporter receptor subunit TctC
LFARPGKLNFGSSGNGTTPHLSGELFNTLAKVNIVHVPYKGAPQAVVDLIAGQVDLMFANVAQVLTHIKSDRLHALATGGARRVSFLPALPTVSEAGVPGFESTGWVGILVPVKTPQDVVTRLNADIVRALRSPDVEGKLRAQGTAPLGNTSEQFAILIRDEYVRWGQVVKLSGAKVE